MSNKVEVQHNVHKLANINSLIKGSIVKYSMDEQSEIEASVLNSDQDSMKFQLQLLKINGKQVGSHVYIMKFEEFFNALSIIKVS